MLRYGMWMCLSLCLLLGASAPALASSGSSILVNYRIRQTSAQTSAVAWMVSNVSARDVTVTITLFDQNDTPVGTGTFLPSISISGPAGTCTGGNTSCVVPAGKSIQFVFTPAASGNDWFGHGRLEWSTSTPDSQPVAVLVTGYATNSPVPATGFSYVYPLIVAGSQPH